MAAAGQLVTSTATSATPLEAVVGALVGLPERIERIKGAEPRPPIPTEPSSHAAVRKQLERLLAHA